MINFFVFDVNKLFQKIQETAYFFMVVFFAVNKRFGDRKALAV